MQTLRGNVLPRRAAACLGGLAVALLLLSPQPAAARQCCCTQDLRDCQDLPSGPCNPTGTHPQTRIIPDDQRCTAAVQDKSASWVSQIIGDELIPRGCRYGPQKQGDCTVNDMLLILVRVTKLILGVMGSVALLMFTYGGYVFLTSAGRAEQVTKGKTILVNAVLGIAVILLSWTIVNLILVAFSLGRGGIGEPGKIFANQWNKGP